MLKRLTVMALIAGMTATPIVTADNSAYLDIVLGQLNDVESRMKPIMEAADRQMELVDRTISVTDNDRNGIYYLTDLEPNTGYLIVGVCDRDCSDIDMQIENDDGETLDTDIEDDDAPVLEFRTDADSDHYKLDLDMVSCSADFCFYGIGVFKTDPEAKSPSSASTDSSSATSFEDVVDVQLENVHAAMLETARNNNYVVEKVNEQKGMLMAGASQTIELKDLVDFEHYAAYAMCDQDCDAIGLKLNAAMFSSNMETVEEETERTAVAGFEFSARPLSDHELEVTMTECSSEPCFFGVVVYELKKEE
ncbi:MAG: hypothetical protein ACE37M_10015 [Henriciella sp.]